MEIKFNKPHEEKECNGGIQKIWNFKNRYTASVIRHNFSYGHENGLWELAVKFDGRIVYDTPITDDVIGNLTEKQVIKLLKRISKLKLKNRIFRKI